MVVHILCDLWCPLKVRFTSEELFEKLELICSSILLKHFVSSGCQLVGDLDLVFYFSLMDPFDSCTSLIFVELSNIGFTSSKGFHSIANDDFITSVLVHFRRKYFEHIDDILLHLSS